MLKTDNISFSWPKGGAAVGRWVLQSLPLQSCSTDCFKVFSMNCLVLEEGGGKKDSQKPQKKIRSSRPHISASPVPRAQTFQSQHFPSLSGLWGVGRGGWNLSNVYKRNQDKAVFFFFFTFISTVKNMDYKKSLISPVQAWSWLRVRFERHHLHFLFYITSLHMTVQAKEPTWCKLNLFGEEDCLSWTDWQASEANGTVEIQAFENPNMAFSSPNALSSNSPLRTKKKADSSYFSLIFHFSFLSLSPPAPQTNRRNLLPHHPSFLQAAIGKSEPEAASQPILNMWAGCTLLQLSLWLLSIMSSENTEPSSNITSTRLFCFCRLHQWKWWSKTGKYPSFPYLSFIIDLFDPLSGRVWTFPWGRPA